MSLHEAISEITELKNENAYLKAELERFKKLIFGSKKETFKSEENPLNFLCLQPTKANQKLFQKYISKN